MIGPGLHKVAKITTQAERARMKRYRMENKAELARKAKIRRRKQKTGQHRKKKRIGTAGAGYSFVVDPGAGPSGRPLVKTKSVNTGTDFTPNRNLGHTIRSSELRGL